MVFIVGDTNQTGSTTNKRQNIHSRMVFIVGPNQTGVYNTINRL